MLIEDALEIYEAGPDIVVKTLCEFCDEINNLNDKVRNLEERTARLSKNSSNSGKRPSSDNVTKPKTENPGNKRKIGAQPGHKGNFRDLFAKDEINVFEDYVLPNCPVCNCETIPTDGPPRVIQQMEIPENPIIKHEHRSYPVWCENCRRIHYMPFPENIAREGLVKVRMTALVAYMKNVCHASFSTIRKFIRDVLGENISRGQLRKLVEKTSRSLEVPYTELLGRLPLEKKVNVDETGHKENKEKFWTWVFRAEMYVLFKIDKSRGSKVLIDVLGKEFDGVLGCDYFSAYRKYMKDFDIIIQFCMAHLIRDIKFLTALPDKETKEYGQRLLNEVKDMFGIIHNHENMSPEEFDRALEKSREKIIGVALKDVPSQPDKNGKETKRGAQNMANRFRKHGKAYFEFITTPQIDPTNNIAEQAIRFIVIDRHVTQGTRSIKGRESCERIWTVIGTCALQGKSAFEFILKSVQAYFNDTAAPSLLDTS